MNHRSVRFRLIAWYAGLLTAVFLLLGVAMYQVLRQYLERSLAEALNRRLEQIQTSLLPEVGKMGERSLAYEIKTRYAPENYDRFIRVSRPDGSVVYASGKAASFDPAGLPVPKQPASTRRETTGDGQQLLITSATYLTSNTGDAAVSGSAVVPTAVFGVSPKTPVASNTSPTNTTDLTNGLAGEMPAKATERVALPKTATATVLGALHVGGGSYLVESGGPMQPIEVILAQWRRSLLLGLAAALLVAVAGGYFLVGRALGPVVAVARSAERITLHNLDERLPITHTGDELEQLSNALNNMIQRLREAFDQNRRFLADASHELRTPLAALRGEMESVVQQARGLPEWRDRVGSALEEVDRLAKIVDTLFAISRLDAGEAQQEWAKFDLARLASGAAEQMSLLAEDKGVSVTCNVPVEVNVEGDRSRLKQVVVNLLDNAIKYTPSGGTVTLNVQAHNGKAVLEVADTGIGIPSTALPHVFERFFRVDKARSRDAGGAGLGLAIVKSICAANGGRVEVESVEGKGSRFRVELPLK